MRNGRRKKGRVIEMSNRERYNEQGVQIYSSERGYVIMKASIKEGLTGKKRERQFCTYTDRRVCEQFCEYQSTLVKEAFDRYNCMRMRPIMQ